jgi:hypothetical protein
MKEDGLNAITIIDGASLVMFKKIRKKFKKGILGKNNIGFIADAPIQSH